jgi:hypothetical protein
MPADRTSRNADTLPATGTFWRAWPDNAAPSDDFRTKAEARAYCVRNGGGAIRKFRHHSNGLSTDMDVIEIPDIWHDDEGVWRQIGGVLHGPFETEAEAEAVSREA